ncbi:MAG TPA: efflux RND transporter permease subunit, partial [Thermoanaerobaculia bacterium]|nr:efflux RND transporter permease subunit [Thermoanaerobaculia bacterium]
SFAFILGCVPLWIAAGAGAASRQILGTVVVAGMLAATCFGVFLIPVLFVVVERLGGAERKQAARPKAPDRPSGHGTTDLHRLPSPEVAEMPEFAEERH